MLNRLKGIMIFISIFITGMPISILNLIVCRNRLRMIFTIIEVYEFVVTTIFVCVMTGKTHEQCRFELRDYYLEHGIEYCEHCGLYKPVYEMYPHYQDMCKKCMMNKAFYGVLI